MAIKATVRMGGAAGSATYDYTSALAVFDEDGKPLLDAGMQVGNGSSCQYQLLLDDDAGGIPTYGVKQIAAHNVVTVSEDGPGYEAWLSRGRVGGTESYRGDIQYGNAVAWRVSVDDANADLKGLTLTASWVRPAETGRARVLAALAAFCNGSPRLTTVIQTHKVVAGGEVSMPAKTYPAGTELTEILDDCAGVEGKTYAVVIHHDAGASHLCFLYRDSQDYTSWVSTLNIDDQSPNLTTSFPPIWDQGPASIREGQDLLTGVVSRYGVASDSFAVDVDAADIDRYDYWLAPYNDDVSVTAGQAATRAAKYRHTHSIERMTHQVTIKLPASKVDLLCAGMTISIRSAAAMGGENLGLGRPRQIAQIKWEPIAPDVGAVDGYYYAHMQLDRPLQVLASKQAKVGPKPPTAGTAESLAAFEDWRWGEQSDPDAAQTEAITNSYPGAPAQAFGVNTACATPNDGFGVVATYACYVHAQTSDSAVMRASAGTVYRFDMTHVRYSPTYRIYVRFYNSADVQIGETVLYPTTTPGTGWITTTADATAPTGTAWMRIDKDVGAPTFSAASVFFDRVTISTVTPAVAGDSTQPVGGTGTGSVGSNVGTYAPIDHDHDHDNITTGGPYHMAEDVTFAPTGIISATNVQAAIAEAASEAGISHVYDPRTYGAVADGVTNDTVDFQEAITAAELVGGVVDGGGKTYFISGSPALLIDANSRVTIQNCTLKFGANVALKVSSTAGGTAHGAVIDNVYFWSTSTTGTTGIYVEDQDRVSVVNSRIDACAVGIDFHPSTEWVEGCSLSDVWITGCTTGIRFFGSGGTSSFHETSFRNVGVNACPTGIDIQAQSEMYRNDWVNVTIWPPNGGTGIKIDGKMEGFRGYIGFDGAAASGGSATGFSIGVNATGLDRCEIWTMYEAAMGGVTFTPVAGALAGSFVYKVGQRTYSTGAAQTGRFVGVTSSGAPATGTYLAGDYVTSHNGSLYVCTVGGTPGTWVAVGAASQVIYEPLTSGADAAPELVFDGAGRCIMVSV